MKKCIYCKQGVPDESVIDFCERCGVGVWGKKMFDAILQNMQSARDKGNLVSTNMNPDFIEEVERNKKNLF